MSYSTARFRSVKLTGSWWKAKLKDEDGQEGPIGLIPSTYVEEVSEQQLRSSDYKVESHSSDL